MDGEFNSRTFKKLHHMGFKLFLKFLNLLLYLRFIPANGPNHVNLRLPFGGMILCQLNCGYTPWLIVVAYKNSHGYPSLC
jgi:hypothetical protein